MAKQVTTLRANLRGQVAQTKLPKWKALLPLFEAIMNSYQAIQEREAIASGYIDVTVEREQQLNLGDGVAKPISFTIRDNGAGFHDDNFESFNTAFSEHKASQGGKGLGRFLWLKAFEKVEIKSTYGTKSGLKLRKFIFDFGYNFDEVEEELSSDTHTGSEVKLVGLRDLYRDECPSDLVKIGQKIIEHFVLLFVSGEMPRITLRDGQSIVDVAAMFQNEFSSRWLARDFFVRGEAFQYHSFRISSERAARHRLIYAANSRSVLNENLRDYVPNLVGRIGDGVQGSAYYYLGIIQGSYLSSHVNPFRTSFDIAEPDADDVDGRQPELLQEIPISEIRKKIIEFVAADLRDIIDELNRIKTDRILSYITEYAPQYKILSRDIGSFIDQISPQATRMDIEAFLHRELHQREVRLRQEGTKIMREAENSTDYEGYQERLGRFVEQTNEMGVSALAHYIVHRRIIIDLMDRAVSKEREEENYPLEKVVHNLIFPMKSNSHQISYSQQNLWVIDERLNYHSFITSDQPLDSNPEQLQTDAARSPDLFIFDRKIVFGERPRDRHPVTSVTLFEFKRPMRKNYTSAENPLLQLLDAVRDIRKGTFLDHRNRPIDISNEAIPAYCYLICDLTPKIRDIVEGMDADPTPDGLGYFGYHKNRRAYFEVISYSKLLRDARQRSQIFFEKLNLLLDP